MRCNKIGVLIIEDNPGDATIIEEMLNELKMELDIRVARDGLEAVHVLEGRCLDLPDMIILDLNLPKLNGYEVLKFIKGDGGLKAIPVVVMTGSLRKEDETRSRDMGAADYCIKPATVAEMDKVTACLKGNLEPIYCGKWRGNCPGTSADAGLGPRSRSQYARSVPYHKEPQIMDIAWPELRYEFH